MGNKLQHGEVKLCHIARSLDVSFSAQGGSKYSLRMMANGAIDLLLTCIFHLAFLSGLEYIFIFLFFEIINSYIISFFPSFLLLNVPYYPTWESELLN